MNVTPSYDERSWASVQLASILILVQFTMTAALMSSTIETVQLVSVSLANESGSELGSTKSVDMRSPDDDCNTDLDKL